MSQKAKPIAISANELNDPFQAILSNTEAALLLLSSSNPDIDKIKAALGDVVSEVMRVTQMIRRPYRAVAGGSLRVILRASHSRDGSGDGPPVT